MTYDVASATPATQAQIEAGIEKLVEAESKVHVTPRILIAPGFTAASGTVTEAQAIVFVGVF